MVEHIDVSQIVSATNIADDDDFGDVLVVVTQHKKGRHVHVFQCEETAVMIIEPGTEKRRMIKVSPRQQARTIATLLERIIQHKSSVHYDLDGLASRSKAKASKGFFSRREMPQPDYDEPSIVDVFGTGEGLANLVSGLLDDVRAFAAFVTPLTQPVRRVGGLMKLW
jgi:hypothetical protein